MSFFEFPHTRTYDSDLGWLIKEVENLDKEYASLISYVNTHKVEYQDLLSRVTALESNINSFETEIEQRFSSLESQLRSEIYVELNKAVAQIQGQLSTIYKDLEDLRSEVKRDRLDMKAYTDALYKLSKDYTDFKIEELINSIPELTTVFVFNPVKGEVTDIQTAIDDLYDITRPDALTAQEYDNLNLTAQEYDNLNLTALEYDLWAKRILEGLGIYKNPLVYMYSPFTGEYVLVKDVVLELSYLHQSDTLTAEEYDLKDKTAQEYDDLLLSAYDYDWHGKSLVI